MQSRGPRINDIMSAREVNEIADSPRGLTVGPTESIGDKDEEAFKKSVEAATNAGPVPTRSAEDITNEVKGVTQNVAKLTNEGKVIIEKVGQTN